MIKLKKSVNIFIILKIHLMIYLYLLLYINFNCDDIWEIFFLRLKISKEENPIFELIYFIDF